DHVQVQVIDRLPGRRSGVEPDVVAVRVELVVEALLDDVHEGDQVEPLSTGCFPPIGNAPPRHDERMPRADRERIGDGEGRGVARQPPLCWHGLEGRHRLAGYLTAAGT